MHPILPVQILTVIKGRLTMVMKGRHDHKVNLVGNAGGWKMRGQRKIRRKWKTVFDQIY